MAELLYVYLIGVGVHLWLLAFACKKYMERPGLRAAFFVLCWPVTFVISVVVGYMETCT